MPGFTRNAGPIMLGCGITEPFQHFVNRALRVFGSRGSDIMDINYLLKRQQISLMRAKPANSVEARAAHEGLARCYGEKLQQSTYPHAAVTIVS